jgi:hypothetical protein
VTFDETAPCPRGVFECAGDKEMEESVFEDEGLQGINSDEEAPQDTTSSTAAVGASRVEGEIISELGAPLHSEGTSASADHRKSE